MMKIGRMKSITIFTVAFCMAGCATDMGRNKLLKENIEKHGIEAGDINSSEEKQPSRLVDCDSIKRDQRFTYLEKRNRRVPGWVGFELEGQENRKKHCFIDGATIKK